MKLVLIGKGQWTVYAVCRDADTCPLLDFIGGLDEKRGARVLADLRDYVPSSQPRDWVASDFSWQLRGTDAILEFRWPAKKGGTPRVLWFYDQRRVIVCTNGVNKKGGIDQTEIDGAKFTRSTYLQDQSKGQLSIVTLDEFDPPDEEDEEQ